MIKGQKIKEMHWNTIFIIKCFELYQTKFFITILFRLQEEIKHNYSYQLIQSCTISLIIQYRKLFVQIRNICHGSFQHVRMCLIRTRNKHHFQNTNDIQSTQ